MGRYKTRLFRSQGLQNVNGIRLKVYTIAAEGREDIDMGPVLRYATSTLAQSPIPWTAHRESGYIIYHAGQIANWLLTRVWLKGDIVSGLLAADYGDGLADVSMPLVECVWEAVVSQYERDAWVRHMMSGEEDPAGYLADFLEDGYH